jgi:glucose-6-phosphate isomerase
MTQYPFFSELDIENQILRGYTHYEERRLSDMKGYFINEERRAHMEEEGNPLVYRVYKVEVPLVAGELLHCITVIEPGSVDGECYMTKGHYHQDESCTEIYVGYKGKGVLVMQKGEETRTIEMRPGTVAYIPGGWGHRTVNISENEPFLFFSIWPAQSGYNYQRAIDEPFLKRIYYHNGGYEAK